VKTTQKNTQNTILKTSKSATKCRFSEGASSQVLADSASFRKRGLKCGFQHQKTCAFSEVSKCKRRLKRKKIPEYRLINNYYKSPQQYWKERNRRKQAWNLYSKGLNIQKIAKHLHVSAKTVSHDLKKVYAYYKGQLNREIRLVREARDAEYMEQLDRLTPAEQRMQLRQNYQVLTKLMGMKQRTRSTLNITVDINEILRCFRDKQEYSRPFITFSPDRLYTAFSDLKLHFRLRVGDELLPYRTLGMSG